MEKIEYVVKENTCGLTRCPGRKEIGRFTNLEDAKKLMESEFLELIDRARNNEFTQYNVYIKKVFINDEGCFSCIIDARHTPFFRYGEEVK